MQEELIRLMSVPVYFLIFEISCYTENILD